MSNQAIDPIASDRRAIASWRFVAGVFAHCALPAFVVVVPFAALAAFHGETWNQLVRRLPTLSGWFVASYAALAALSVLLAAIVDPILRRRYAKRQARDPNAAALASGRRLAQAIADGRRALDDRSRTLLDTLSRPVWDHGDPRYQALANDLAEVVRTSSAALSSAAPERRQALYDLAAESLANLNEALKALTEERAGLDEGDARAIARYVRLRHAQSDFAGDPL